MALLLKDSEIRGLLSELEYVDVIESAFRLYAQGKCGPPQMMHVAVAGGEFHIKAGRVNWDEPFAAIKINGDFPRNPESFGQPALRGVIVLFDGKTGTPISIMDSSEITLRRTAAATAVAAKYLARPDSHTVLICGCGKQGRAHLRMLSSVLPVARAKVFSRDGRRAALFASEMSSELDIPVEVAGNLVPAALACDIVVTCTRSRAPFLDGNAISQGTFIAAIGADTAYKQELDPELLKKGRVVVDLLEQCAKVGELHHALRAGMAIESVHAELAEVVVGARTGRMSSEEITIFDSTGTAFQDVATAISIYRAARRQGRGEECEFTDEVGTTGRRS